MKLRKIILTMLASATILGLGANLQPTLVNARRIRIYRVRRHHTYHHRRMVRNRKRSKNVKRTRRNKRTRSIKRAKKTKVTRRTKRSKRNYHPRIRRHRRILHKSSRNSFKRKVRRQGRRQRSHRSIYSYFSSKQIKHLAKLDHETVRQFKSDNNADNNNDIYGPARIYNIDGFYLILTPHGMRFLARINHQSVRQYEKAEIKHTTKYWHYDGTPTKLAIRLAERYAIKGMNRAREARGIAPLVNDPNLQFLANKLSEQGNYSPTFSQIQQLANEYNIPDTANAWVNGTSGIGDYEKPSHMANDVASDPNSTILNPQYNSAGDGQGIELFSDNGYVNNNDRTESVSQANDDAKQKTLSDLRQDRASVGEEPLNEDPTLDSIAQQRSQQLVNNFSHYDGNGNPYVYDDGLNSDNWAENIAWQSGAGQSAADEMNQGLFYNEESSGGGHYENIVNNNNVGVGITNANGNTYLAEDFD